MQGCCHALAMAFEICKLFKCSPKYNAAFDRIKSESDEDFPAVVGIRKFSPTRWTIRGESISSIIDKYNVSKQLWDGCLENKLDADVKGRLIGAKSQLSSMICCLVFISVKESSKFKTSPCQLQKVKVQPNRTVLTLKGMRNMIPRSISSITM